ncbi:uracil-DNA glycosylase [Rickettsiales bacterium]|nr:uracil-DNA glycosylase [Rickettsiales bacterium]
MIIKNTKSFMDFCNQIGINDLINKTPTVKFKEISEGIGKFRENESLIKKNNTDFENQEQKVKEKIIESEKEKKLEILKKKINRQALSIKETATNFVFSDGNINSKIMFISDAPGSEEDRCGIPFSGKEGKLLSLMLSYIGLNKKNCYFSNLIFWRPPGNRVPSKEEIKICLPFTKEHIDIIQPELIVLVGGIASNSILNCNEGVTKLRGREFFYKTKEKRIKTHVIFHPSFLINNPIEKKRTWFDLTTISEIIKNEKHRYY